MNIIILIAVILCAAACVFEGFMIGRLKTELRSAKEEINEKISAFREDSAGLQEKTDHLINEGFSALNDNLTRGVMNARSDK